jgi:hypothetical protein
MATPNVVVAEAWWRTPSAAPGALTGNKLAAIQQRLRDAKRPEISWHIILNNHASTRPKECGGKLCTSVTQCKQFSRVGPMHRCLLTLPNSYAADDGKVVCVEGIASDKKTAGEDACCLAFAVLCSDFDKLQDVVLRSAHYTVSREELINDLAQIVTQIPSATVQPLAEHHAASGATFEGTLQDVPAAADWEYHGTPLDATEIEFLRLVDQNDETVNAWGFPDGGDREHCSAFWRTGPGRVFGLPADLLNPWQGLE